ncbi:protein kinase, putative [Entamoeba histolytica HM-1:IMSS-B]|uniref:Protein kinase, putative n=7 Tax=Entamoeba histolytica TaxID=5759 RepID=C4LSL4_ENTH1|nr:protein kinase, putative [Entamoeba histolytica HM-1:IMSS]EMD46633.1 serine/threonine protein kinase Chk2,putative [Entamoeba histolytica KU27]EMH75693.1 protein kinase, putative [Entamoeba histolytica HM-1:IMSS-B]ENY59912.1 serine/threonine protein kinase Chk2, putative [Entamoeba histolytica HM-1:IMSS-A]GAT91420.1 protein kinase putative [Entamoeba histolytica]EAL52022.1 protein kinase, putative [Entamoeba histolytica HM-1:IMSS]|eukprot:XP_657408.1 protein kinase, putative [Entamoeba histolytica HM-1:IMSS]
MNKKWGVLCSLGRVPSLLLIENETMIGRSNKFCCLSKEKSISHKHCIITRVTTPNENLSHCFITDNSINGTFINRKYLGKGVQEEIHCFDTLTLLDPGLKEHISYVFIDNEFKQKQIEEGGPFEHYEVKGYIGEGTFGIVRRVIEKETQEEYVMKEITRTKGSAEESGRRESEVLRKTNHENIVKMKGVFKTNQYLYIIMEYVRGGELLDALKKEKRMSEAKIKTIMYQIFSALKYLHENNIIHRDLKLENVMLCGVNLKVKLADFGFGRIIDQTQAAKTHIGTTTYFAPELFKDGDYNGTKVDMWAAGIMMYFLATGKHPFEQLVTFDKLNCKWSDFMKRVISGKRDDCIEFKNCSPEFQDLVNGLLEMDQKKRLSAQQCLCHEFFTSRKLLKICTRTNELEQRRMN